MSIFEPARSPWPERMLAVLRIAAGLMFFWAGTTILFGWPPPSAPMPAFDLLSQMGIGALLELVGGALIVLGLLTRPVAFLLSGEMAVAYFQFHFPQAFFPNTNNGIPAVLYCFLFLYLVFAGAGACSLDGLIARIERATLSRRRNKPLEQSVEGVWSVQGVLATGEDHALGHPERSEGSQNARSWHFEILRRGQRPLLRMTLRRRSRRPRRPDAMIVHLVDGTYELFRHFYGIRRFRKSDPPLGAVAGVLGTVAQMIDEGATHIGVATDHVIESFRNDLWPGYKTGEGIEPALLAQFHPLEEALVAMGVATWPMIELEADDALASAAWIAGEDERVEKVCIWTPDKDLAQCVEGQRVVQVVRKSGEIRDEEGVRTKFGVLPERIADYLALVGDAADGYPGIPKWGPRTAARFIARYGPIESFPPEILGAERERALLFKTLATLRTDAALFGDVEELRWRGPAASFGALAETIDPRLAARVRALAGRVA